MHKTRIAALVLSALAFTALVPSAQAALIGTSWSGTDTCESTVNAVTVTYCNIQAFIQLWMESTDTGVPGCTKTGSTFISCSSIIDCSGGPFTTRLPAHFSYSCTGFPSQSCDVLQPGTYSGCSSGAFGSGYTASVSAGTCGSFTVRVDLVPLQNSNVPPILASLNSAHLSHTLHLCVNAVTGPSIS